MNCISLSTFAARHGQQKAAELLGTTQGALSKAIRLGRVIYVKQLPDGAYEAKELRPFPSQKCTPAEPGSVQSETNQSGADSMSRRPV